MASTAVPSPAAVVAAQDGDPDALRHLVLSQLPLLYNLVARAADPRVDVAEVLEQTVTLVGGGMPGMADPERFRPWLLGTALRFLWSAEERGSGQPGDRRADLALTAAPPGAAGAADQRREADLAAGWLAAEDRVLLSLWWLEVSGELTTEEAVAAGGLPPADARARLRAVAARFEDARTAVRALSAEPRCGELAGLLTRWDHRPSERRRRQVARHVADCPACSDHAADLIPADRLLRGFPLVNPPADVVDRLLARAVAAQHRYRSAVGSRLPMIDAVRRIAAARWTATVVRVTAVAIALALLVGALMSYADSRADRSTQSGLTSPPATTPE